MKRLFPRFYKPFSRDHERRVFFVFRVFRLLFLFFMFLEAFVKTFCLCFISFYCNTKALILWSFFNCFLIVSFRVEKAEFIFSSNVHRFPKLLFQLINTYLTIQLRSDSLFTHFHQSCIFYLMLLFQNPNFLFHSL